MPGMTLEQRWSMSSIKDYYQNGATVKPKDVFKKIQDIWRFYMDLEGNLGAYTALPLIDTLSYFMWLFQYAPYVKYEGEKGSSKSKACEIHEYLDFNAFLGVDYTPAVIFRTIQDTRGTLIIDEAEGYDKIKNKSEYELAREAIINAGFKRNGKVTRLDSSENHYKRLIFHVFGVKVIGSIHGNSETISDRSYLFELQKTLNKEISRRTPNPEDPLFQEARDSLYLMALNYWKEIRYIVVNKKVENRLDLIGREWDKAFPLLVMATFYARHDRINGKEILDDLWRFIEDQRNKEYSFTLDSFDLMVIDQVEAKLINSYETSNTPAESNCNLTLRDVAQTIAEAEGIASRPNFNLRTYSHTVHNKITKLAIGNNFRPGTGNVTIFTTNVNLIRNARRRYGTSGSAANKLDPFKSIKFVNLIDSINSFKSELIEIKLKKDRTKSNNYLLSLENIASLKKVVEELNELNAEVDSYERDHANFDGESQLVYRRITSISPLLNSDPTRFTKGSIWQMSRQEAIKLCVYNFSDEVSQEEILVIPVDQINELDKG